MTMIGAANIKFLYGQNVNEIILAGDTRLTFPTEKGKFTSKFESAQKVIDLSPNIVIGIAGDYKVMDLLLKYKKKLLAKDYDGKPNFCKMSSILKLELKNYIMENFRSEWTETSFFIMMRDFREGKKKLYKLDLPQAVFIELGEGVHFIGGDAHLRASLAEKYVQHYNQLLKEGLNQSNIALPLLMTLGGIQADDIGGSLTAYYMKETGWGTIGYAFSSDSGDNWISSALGESGWQQQVNAKFNAKITPDLNEIKQKVNKAHNTTVR